MTQNPPPRNQPSAVTNGCCENCNADDPWILHHLKHQNEYRKVCTSCVLKLNQTLFCPTCFNLIDPNSLTLPPIPPSSSSSSSSSNINRNTLKCLKCSSITHITCVPANTPKSPYLCPPCSDPNFKFFDLKKPKINLDLPLSNGGKRKVVEEARKVIDGKTARVFHLAARISSCSMNKAVAQANAEVERKVGVAALAKKRAKEAIDHLMTISANHEVIKQQMEDLMGSGSGAKENDDVVPLNMERNGAGHNVGVSGVEKGSGSGSGSGPGVQSNGGTNENDHRGKGKANGKDMMVID